MHKSILFRLTRLTLLSAMLATPSARADEPLGGGGFERPTEACLQPAERVAIHEAILVNRIQLSASKKIGAAGLVSAPLFSWPLKVKEGFSDPGYHAISNYVDHDGSSPNQILDHNCNAITYDGHKGTDYFLWPFDLIKMDNDDVEVVAAAPGTIILRQDGNFDRECSSNNNPWNAVFIQHSDGSEAWYGHLKKNSLTSKTVGQSVARGEYLGVVGSSGSSTGPHLHFEVYDSNDNLIDPYQGSCNGLNSSSWWQQQRPYYDSAINKIATHSAEPALGTCPTPGIPSYENVFNLGDRIYFASYYRDQLSSQQSQHRILRPDGSVYNSWSHTSSVAHYNSSYWYWWRELPSWEDLGQWTYEITFEGEVYEHNFTVGRADVAVFKTANTNTVSLHNQITYTLMVTNNSLETATDVWIYDDLPENSFGNITPHPSCSFSSNRMACFIGYLYSEESISRTLAVTWTNLSYSTIATNIAEVTTGTWDPNLSNNEDVLELLLDHDNDGIPTLFEKDLVDSDEDGTPAFLDDNDGLYFEASQNGGATHLSWSFPTGATFQIQSTLELNPNSIWSNVPPLLIGGQTNHLFIHTNTVSERIYYRLRVNQLPGTP